MAGIYVHIPFCKQRCIYCDFYSTALHDRIDTYVDCLVKEARMRPAEDIKTVYFGGGTPSQLSPEQMTRLVNGLRCNYDLSGVEEFTVEVNPDDVTVEYMHMLKLLGVNRISMGVQSFVDSELALINRRHNAQGALDAIACMRQAGIDNVSVDLIYGIPGQTLASWRESVSVALSVGAQHISAYNLSYEMGTRLWQMRERGEITEVDEATCVEMYKTLTKMLRDAGYVHYEISNYSLPEFHSRHNSSYWDCTPYVGLGASAHSYDGIHRSYNPASINEYIGKINRGELASVVEETEWWERYDETIMIGLRTARGLDTEMIKREFGDKVCDYLLSNAQQYIDSKELVKEGANIRITEYAFMMSDAIIRDLMWDE